MRSWADGQSRYADRPGEVQQGHGARPQRKTETGDLYEENSEPDGGGSQRLRL